MGYLKDFRERFTAQLSSMTPEQVEAVLNSACNAVLESYRNGQKAARAEGRAEKRAEGRGANAPEGARETRAPSDRGRSTWRRRSRQ